MANWSDCTMSFTGDLKILELIEKEAEKKEFVDYTLVDFVDGCDETPSRLFFSCSGRWSADYDWFADTCMNHGVAGQLQDAESGSDFFVEIEIDENGSVNSNTYKYFCKRSVEVFEIDYFYDYYYDVFDCIEEACGVIKKFVEFGEVEYEVINHLIGDEEYEPEPNDANKKTMNDLLANIPHIGESSEEPLVFCKIDDLFIIEAEKKDSCSYEVTGLNYKSGEWESKIIHLGLIVLSDEIVPREKLTLSKVNLDNKLVA